MFQQVKERLNLLAILATVAPAMGLLVVWLMGPWLLNERFRLRQDLNPPPRAENLVIIALDQSFGEHYAFPEVTPRDYLARLVRTVAAYGPRVIALDYKFIDADRQDSTFSDFVQAVAEAGNVVLPSMLAGHPGPYIQLPIPTGNLRARARTTGYALLWGDPVRRMRLQVELADGRTAPSFALAALAAWHFPDGSNAEALDWDAVFDILRFPRPGTAPFYVNYHGPVNTDFFTVYASEEFLTAPDKYADLLHDKLVLIGSTYLDAQAGDAFHTPYGEMRGVEVHANIIQNLLSRRYFTPAHPGPFWTMLCVLLTLLFAFFCFRRTQTLRAFLYTTLFLITWSLVSFALFIYFDVLLPLNVPLGFGFAGLLVFSFAQRLTRGRRTPKSFLNLDLALEKDGETYTVSIEAPGVPRQTSAPRPWPRALAIPLKPQQHAEEPLKQMKEVGHQLFQMLFPSPLAACYRRCRRRTRRPRWRPLGLRIRLHLDDQALHDVPWECLYDRQTDCFLAAHPAIVFVRMVRRKDEPSGPQKRGRAAGVLLALPDPSQASRARLGLPARDHHYEAHLITTLHAQRQDARTLPRVDVLQPAQKRPSRHAQGRSLASCMSWPG